MPPVRPLVLSLALMAFALASKTMAGQHLPLSTCFVGEAKFRQIVAQARAQNWGQLPMGERVMKCAQALQGTPYKGFTLEIHDRVESPSVNLHGLDCWTFFETSLGLARMLETARPNYTPEDLLREVEITRYRGGTCGGDYLERIHELAEWYFENGARRTIDDLTGRLGGVRFQDRRCTEMTTLWRSYRYLRKNPDLRTRMAGYERQWERLPARYIPRERVPQIEGQLRNGDVIGIATRNQGGYCSHVGLAYRASDGRIHLMHASSDADKVIVDVPLVQYLHRYQKNMGILVGRPLPARATERDRGRYLANLRRLTGGAS